MAKPNRGGKRTSATSSSIPPQAGPATTVQQTVQQQNNPVINQVQQPTPQDVAKGNVLPKGGVAFNDFMKMSDDQKADVITQALGQSLPFFLDDSGIQKLAYYTGLSEKPQLVDESTLKSMAGHDLWRSVHNSYDSNNDIGYTSKDIYNQIATGDFTMYSDTGGSVHGKAIYFDVNKGSYGSGRGYTVMHAKVLKSAKTISEYSLDSQWSAEQRSGSKLAQAISRADHYSRRNLYALAKGYDVIISGSGGRGYHMVINRRGIALSKTTF